jgi:hypothetical protein
MIDATGLDQATDDRRDLVLAARRAKERDVTPDGFLGRVAVHPFSATVPAQDPALERLGEHRIVRGLDYRGQLLLDRLRPLALGDVDRKRDPADNGATPAPQRSHIHEVPTMPIRRRQDLKRVHLAPQRSPIQRLEDRPALRTERVGCELTLKGRLGETVASESRSPGDDIAQLVVEHHRVRLWPGVENRQRERPDLRGGRLSQLDRRVARHSFDRPERE